MQRVTIKTHPVCLNMGAQLGRDRRFEFLKLDTIDVKVASWIYEKHPKALYAFLEYIAPGYHEKGIDLDLKLLYTQLIKAHE